MHQLHLKFKALRLSLDHYSRQPSPFPKTLQYACECTPERHILCSGLLRILKKKSSNEKPTSQWISLMTTER